MTRSVSLFKYNSAPKDYALLNNSLYIFRCRDNFSPSLPILQLLLLDSSKMSREPTHTRKRLKSAVSPPLISFYFIFSSSSIIFRIPRLSQLHYVFSRRSCAFFSLSLGLFLGSGGKKKKTGTSSAHNQQSSPLYVINARASG